MAIIEVTRGDIFSSGELTSGEFVLTHCISADYALGAGIAKEIERRYDVKRSLLYWGTHKTPDCLMVNNIINIVTKRYCYNKPTYDSFKAGLELTRQLCLENNITKLVMPKIGCGLDKLEWEKVYNIIGDILVNSGIDISVYYLKE